MEEINLISEKMYWGKVELPPPRLSPEEGALLLVYVASGMKRGKVVSPEGIELFRARGDVAESVMLLLPPRCELHAEWSGPETEAYGFGFRWPGLEFDIVKRRFMAGTPGGRRQKVGMVHRLTAQEVILLRPFTEWTSGNFFRRREVAGAELKARLIFPALLSFFVEIDAAMMRRYSASPLQQFEKLIEEEDHVVKLGEMAGKVGRSPRWIRGRFKAEYGLTPRDAKRENTLHQARFLIKETELPFKQIAWRLGMKSAAYFSYYIKRHTGLTPRQLRARKEGRGGGGDDGKGRKKGARPWAGAPFAGC